MSQTKPTVVEKWEAGIGASQYKGFASMRNVDINSHPGSLRLNPQLTNTIPTSVGGTFTANAGTDILTGPDLQYVADGVTGNFGIIAVIFTTSGTLPAGLSLATTYWLVVQGGNTTTYKVATTLANAQANIFVDITGAGTGTHTLTMTVPGYAKYFAQDPVGKLYAVDQNGRVWQQTGNIWNYTGNTTLTNANGNGLVVWKGYLFVFRNNSYDAMNLSTLAWTYAGDGTWVGTLNGGTGSLKNHPSIASIDDKLYFADADSNIQIPYIISLSEVLGKTFNPTDSTTYTQSLQTITLPKYKIVNAVNEIGINLIFGTTGKEIIPYDRGVYGQGIPIVLPEKNITAMVVVNNLIYAGAGTQGNIYVSNTSSADLWKAFPKHLLASDYATTTIGAMATMGKKLLYTIQSIGCSGVYSVDLITKSLVMENTISTGSLGTTNPLILPALFSTGLTYYVSSDNQDTSAVTLDEFTTSSGYIYPTGYIGFVETFLYPVGSPRVKAAFAKLEIALGKLLTTSHGVRVSWRQNLTDAYVAITTFDFSTFGGLQSTYQDALMAGAENVQLKIELTATGVAANTTPELRDIILT